METVGRWTVPGEANQLGYRSITVPGFVRGVGELHAAFGRLPWSELPRPAAHLARAGYRVFPYVERTFHVPARPGYPGGLDVLSATPAAAALFTRQGRPLARDDLLVQPEFAAALETIARDGADALYTGTLGDAMAADFERHGAFVTRADLAAYRAVWEPPLRARYRDVEVATAGPPAQGTTLIEMLNLFALLDPAGLGLDTPRYVDRLARAQRLAFEDEARHLDDPAQAAVPVARLVDPAHARARLGVLEGDPRAAARVTPGVPGTTHVTAADDEGTVVALTHTLGMGSGVVTPGLGFMYNNFMGQFSPVPGTPHALAPGKRRGGTVPTLLVRDGRPAYALGASGGSRITSAVARVIVNLLDHGMGVQAAVSHPRFHLEADALLVEAGIPAATTAALRADGWRVEPAEALAIAHAVRLAPDVAAAEGGSDHRGAGGAVLFSPSVRSAPTAPGAERS
jgi:gamma-glutamyltranspeptidase/glutathione hydrolase